MKFTFEVPIKAKYIRDCDFDLDNKHPLENGKIYDVEDIRIWQSNTKIIIDGNCYNSVCFKFYAWNREIDIFNSAITNTYFLTKLPFIKFVDKESEE